MDPARAEDKVGHQLDGIARRPVLAGLFVVLFVELAHQLLEQRAHRVVVHRRVLDGAVAVFDRMGAEVDFGVEELGDQGAEGVGLGQTRDGVAELEVVQDVLHVGGKAVEVGVEVGFELLLIGAGLQVAEGKLRGVVECLLGSGAQRGPCSVIPALSSMSLVSRTAFLVGSSTASSRRRTHMGRITSRYLPRTNRSRSTSSAMPQMNETILLCVAWSMSIRFLAVSGRTTNQVYVRCPASASEVGEKNPAAWPRFQRGCSDGEYRQNAGGPLLRR